jgi:alginate O-acetyltransferase complex protein AlgI
MTICSLTFLLYCGGLALVVQLAPGKWLRQLLLASASSAFLASLVPDQRSWSCFAVVLAITYAALVLVRAWPRGGIATLGIALAVFLYLYLKRYALVSQFIPMPFELDLEVHPVEVVGVSYMTFKFIHMLVDQWEGQLAPFNLWSYLNYQLSFFTLTAGPIQRYNDFLSSWDAIDRGPGATRDGVVCWIRILTGMIKIGVFGAYFQSAFRAASYGHRTFTLQEALICFYEYPVYLYCNFSGYTDVMIGAAGLLGFRLPENFNRPWLARNVLDFWDRWHITLTHWIRDYVFMTSYKTAATRFPRAARYWSYALLFVALFLAGVWHGTTSGFVMFGVLNGLGAAVTRAYGDLLRATLGRKGVDAYLRNPVMRLVAVVTTLHYVCLSQLFFSSDFETAIKILASAGTEIYHLPTVLTNYASHAVAVAIGIVAVLLIALWKNEAIAAIRLPQLTAGNDRRLWSVLCLECLFVGGMFFVGWAFQQPAAPVVYMAF